jgi:nucleotide-binding universal stress UspA family protein
MKLNHIVHPTDFSEVSELALKYAAKIAKHTSATLHLVHTYERPYKEAVRSGVITAMMDKKFDAEIRDGLYGEMVEMSKQVDLEGLDVKVRLVGDVSPSKFYEALREDKMDLIVMGTKGATGLFHGGLVDTVTERVIRHATVPVLSIPEGSVYSPFSKILFATDFQEGAAEAFGHVVDFAKMFDAEVVVGFINTRDNFASSEYAEVSFNAMVKANPYTKASLREFNAETVTEGIARLVDRMGIDIVAMMTHGRTGLAHLLYGSVAEDVASYVKVPLLTFKLG